jgi:hypothetical protein
MAGANVLTALLATTRESARRIGVEATARRVRRQASHLLRWE